MTIFLIKILLISFVCMKYVGKCHARQSGDLGRKWVLIEGDQRIICAIPRKMCARESRFEADASSKGAISGRKRSIEQCERQIRSGSRLSHFSKTILRDIVKPPALSLQR
jgi:hypothetical protein